jgi:hypothetical protein
VPLHMRSPHFPAAQRPAGRRDRNRQDHLPIAIARSCIRSRARFYNMVDLVNRFETEARNARHGQFAAHLTRMESASSTNSAICPP